MSNNHDHFTPRTLRQEKRDGSVKYRDLMVPTEETMQRHRDMLQLLYSLRIPMPYATGAVPGRELLDNVRPHRQSNFFYMTDLKNAFPSVDTAELTRIMATSIIPELYQPAVDDFITNWAIVPGTPGLPLGAPASPYLFNLYCLPMDRQLGAYCENEGITYTRYLDDLTFSAQSPIGKQRRRHLISMIEDRPGMTINHAKSRVQNLEYEPVTVTGVSLYPDRRLSPSPGLLEAARQAFAEVDEEVLSGRLIFEDSIARIHGYHGAIHQLSDGETPAVRKLDRIYVEVLGKLGIQAVKSA